MVPLRVSSVTVPGLAGRQGGGRARRAAGGLRRRRCRRRRARPGRRPGGRRRERDGPRPIRPSAEPSSQDHDGEDREQDPDPGDEQRPPSLRRRRPALARAWRARSQEPRRCGRPEWSASDGAAGRGGEESRGSLQGGGVVDGPGQERFAEDDARRAGIAHAADRRRGRARRRRPGRSASSVRARSASCSSSAPAPPCDSTNRRTPQARARRGRPAGWAARRCQGNAAKRSGRGSMPTASQSPATATHRGPAPGPRRRSCPGPRASAPAAKARRMASGLSSPPATWIGRRDPAGDRADGLEVDGGARPGPVEIDQVDDRRAEADEVLARSARAGRSARRRRWRRPARRRRATGPARGRSPGGPAPTPRPAAAPGVVAGVRSVARPSPARSRRWKLIGSEPARSSESWKARSRNAGPRRRCSSSRSSRSITLPSRYESW